jgi:hypothetical protein
MILGIGFATWFYTIAGSPGSKVERDKITIAALAQAKVALIGYAVGVSNLAGGGRPGDLPCPDTNDSGSTGTSCGNATGTTGQTLRIGRLPWKSLGLPDLRDGDGERLWYAVSNNFKYNNRTACTAPGDAGCLNSDARGTITVRDSSGSVVNDGNNPDPFTPSGVVAVIFAPGAILQRQGAASPQDRSCTGGTCTAAGICSSGLPAKCDPTNYLDVLSGVEDNADFIDGSNANGFINGVIRDANGNAIVNDRLMVITYQDIMPALQRRVAQEVMNCLASYATVSQNNGRFPWAVPTGNWPSFADQTNTLFGRVPDNPLNTTAGTGSMCPSNSNCMSSNWPASCGITQGSWWTNWKESVFYGLASNYAPASPTSTWTWGGGWSYGQVPAGGGCGGTACLLVNPPSAAVDKRVVVVVAGKRLSPVNGGQPRTFAANKSDPANYLEGTNVNTATSYTYEVQPISVSFNDFLLYQ